MQGEEQERMQPPGEPGMVEQAAEETKRIDEQPEDEDPGADENGEENPAPDSPLAADEPAEQDVGEQS
jgi:hypothetical protein